MFSHIQDGLQFAYRFGNEIDVAAGTRMGLDHPVHEVNNGPGCSLKLGLLPEWCFMGCVILLGAILPPDSDALEFEVGYGGRTEERSQPLLSLLRISDCGRCHDTHTIYSP